MSDLLGSAPPVSSGGNGRPQNGSSRTPQGPALAQSADPPRGVRTPTQIMSDRRQREARKLAQQEAEQQRLREQEEMIRRQQQAGQGVGVVEGQRRRPQSQVPSGVDSQYAQNPSQGQSTYQQVTTPTRRPENIPAQTQQPPPNRQRPPEAGQTGGAYVSGALPPGTTRRPNAADNSQNPIPQATNPIPEDTPQNTQQGQSAGQQSGRAAFPHAFERWETLSSHWEGLTSYWIRRLQENSSEINTRPLDQQMSRQITDLSAAGANLFHAVVELQRLRASSERKFQRWFFETRDEQERAREREAELERQLRTAREDQGRVNTTSLAAAEAAQLKAEQLVLEMKRELQISKEEARRAWEELGRREQEERDRTIALRSGEPTLIGGVQVVPMQGIPSRQTSTAARQVPPTREGTYPGGPGSTTMGGMPPTQQPPSRSQNTSTTLDSPGDEQRQFNFQAEGDSPTGTDPFTESRGGDTGRQYYTTPQRPTQPPSSSAAIAAAQAATTAPSPGRGHRSTTSSAPGQSSLHPAGRSGTAGTDPSDQPSYIPSTASGNGSSHGGDEEYEINPDGSYTRDGQGRRIPYGASIGGSQPTRTQQQPLAESDDGSDEYDVAADVERERQHLQRYGGGGSSGQSNLPRTTSGNIPIASPTLADQQRRQQYSPVSVSPPTQSLTAAASQFAQTSQAGPTGPISPVSPDYSGSAYGATGTTPTGITQPPTGWENIRPTHRHPTRLSDILEERSGRTSPSRASYASASGPPDVPVPTTSSAYPRR